MLEEKLVMTPEDDLLIQHSDIARNINLTLSPLTTKNNSIVFENFFNLNLSVYNSL